MLGINQLTTDWYLDQEYKHKKAMREQATGKKDDRLDYLRVDGISVSSSASTAQSNLDRLTSEANAMWAEHGENVKLFLRQSLDERYGDNAQ